MCVDISITIHVMLEISRVVKNNFAGRGVEGVTRIMISDNILIICFLAFKAS